MLNRIVSVVDKNVESKFEIIHNLLNSRSMTAKFFAIPFSIALILKALFYLKTIFRQNPLGVQMLRLRGGLQRQLYSY